MGHGRNDVSNGLYTGDASAASTYSGASSNVDHGGQPIELHSRTLIMKAQDILPDHVNQADLDGVTIRKGTVGAFLVNARTWMDPATSAPHREEAQRDIVDALPALRALGLFEVLDIRDAALRGLIEAH
jgi:hypothetical protein